jgi:hemolysin D
LREAQAASAETRETRNAALAEIRRTLSDRLTQAQRSLAELQPQGTKAEQRQQLTRLVAPVTGTVQQLAVHTPGGVVTPAQVLLVVVPDAAEVVAEVTVDNKDIGFVQEGQKATIKLETFPFTRFGTVPATVQKVSADAVIDETRGAVFTAVLKLDRAHIDVNGRATSIAPGMNLTAEVKTGQRRVIDYVLSPVQRHSEEGMRER